MEKIKIREIRDMSTEELHKRIADERVNLENLRFQHATSRIQNTDHLKKSRHLIARMMTIVREREMGKGEQHIVAPKQTSKKVSKTEE